MQIEKHTKNSRYRNECARDLDDLVGHVHGHRDGLERKMQHQVSFVLDAEIDAYDAATRREPAQLVT